MITSNGLPPAQSGDICILLEPAQEEISGLRRLQRLLQAQYGGRPQQRIHFTGQRFAPGGVEQLGQIVDALQERVASLPPFPVHATSLVLAAHPFWGFYVLRWDLRICRAMQAFSSLVETALAEAGARPHYPSGGDWNPHVTALEAIPETAHVLAANGNAPSNRYLYTGRRLVLSQVQPGKQFAIVHTLPLGGSLPPSEPPPDAGPPASPQAR